MSDLPTEVAAPTYPVLTRPVEGIPDLVDTPARLQDAISVLAAGSGPVSIDTERAHGFRYTAKAYLIQVRRAGAATHLIDPVALEQDDQVADLSNLGGALGDAEWILHAASQDLPCLVEVGMVPDRLFDTELAARLLGIPKVNLGALMEEALGLTLLKQHSAADWSRRPLPEEWLAYAALDVERLHDLEEWLIEKLESAGKLEWARQEFAHLVTHACDPHVSVADPWRRTSGLHAVHSPLGLAVVRELWTARDELAAAQDKSPGRILNDRAISELAVLIERTRATPTRTELRAIRGFVMRAAARYENVWLGAVGTALALPRTDLPARHVEQSGPPQPRTWENRWPDSFQRWSRVRPALVERAGTLEVPVENLIAPDVIKRLLWEAPASITDADLEARLTELGARQWQRELVAPTILAHW
ncbi:MAG: HRDC domain-containing protein [Propionicimonas sp.]